jgi:hypothetical protein
MPNPRTNWQAWVLAAATGMATLAWYLTGRNYTGRIGSILLVAFAACCAVACAVYVGRALGNKIINDNPWLTGAGAFGTALTVLFGVWEFWVDVAGVGNDFDYAVGWGIASAFTAVLGFTEIRAAGKLVADLADSARHSMQDDSTKATSAHRDPTFRG